MGTLPLQKILFGSPGTGKSYMIREIATDNLGIQLDPSTRTSPDIIKTVFHPEYTYGDFMGKLLPHGQGNNVTYKYYAGHFLKALGRAYRNILEHKDENEIPWELLPPPQCLLVIDELNRGNASAIFGTVFQLLDREEDGWSSYEIDLSDLELVGLLTSMNHKVKVVEDELSLVDRKPFEQFIKDLKVEKSVSKDDQRLLELLSQHKVSLPPNLSIIGTINTSDESIYYLDSAFKRRWDWQHIAAPLSIDDAPNELKSLFVNLPDGDKIPWAEFIVKLNEFIRSHHQSIRRIEDKQIGWWFIKPINGEISFQQVKDKLLFYLWDTVFAKDRRPLEKKLSRVLGNERLVTFTDFVEHAEAFLSVIYIPF